MKKSRYVNFDLNRSVGNLLRLGVYISVATSLFGFIKLFSEGFKMPKNYEELELPESNVWSSFWHSLMNLEGMAIIQLGILFLIFTPLIRIIFALIGYIKEKDLTYVVISLIVLGIMAFSFFTGFAH